VAVDDGLESVNVNADEVATSVAVALGAQKLIFLSDIEGIRGSDGEIASEASAGELASWIDSGVVTGGMIPKAKSILEALSAGIDRVTVADGRVPHAVIIELLTVGGVGTMVRNDRVSSPELE
jgi:acetylglutamate kinase